MTTLNTINAATASALAMGTGRSRGGAASTRSQQRRNMKPMGATQRVAKLEMVTTVASPELTSMGHTAKGEPKRKRAEDRQRPPRGRRDGRETNGA